MKDEDCLNLNVFTPAADGAGRPVLVHMFGGGFQAGSANSPLQDAAGLASVNDVVVVRVNTRVGALGFLWLGGAWGPPYSAGNVALLDLCAALEWVRENISALGGDPGRVTLFGLSSGAFSIAALAAIPASSGLFQGAWMQSGSASRVVAADVAASQADEFLRVLDIERGNLSALQAITVDNILEAQERIVATDLGERNAPGGRTLGVVQDGLTMTCHPQDALRGGVWRDIPIVLGSTRDEARLWFARGLLKPIGSRAALQAEIERLGGAAQSAAILGAYAAAHPDLSMDSLRERILGDVIYRLPALQTAAAQTAAGGAAWVYRFDWQSPVEGGTLGASHGFDEAFVWNTVDRAPFASGSPTARAVAAAMSGAVIGFARNRHPRWTGFARGELNVEIFGRHALSVDDATWLLNTWSGVERR